MKLIIEKLFEVNGRWTIDCRGNVKSIRATFKSTHGVNIENHPTKKKSFVAHGNYGELSQAESDAQSRGYKFSIDRG